MRDDVEATKKSKLLILLFLLGAVLMGALAYLGMYSTSKEHLAEINRVIEGKGGKVEQITVMPVDESPFEQSGKGNTIYKIVYQKDGKSWTAWYRSDNHSSIMKEKEEWILPE
jgi:flagellar basal body-associated protein FliL